MQRVPFHLQSIAPLCIRKMSGCFFNQTRHLFVHKQTPNRNILPSSMISLTKTQISRKYSKSRDKPKSSGKKKLELREDILGEYFNVDKIKLEMNDVVDYMKEQFIEALSIRSSLGAIENIQVEYEGTQYTIQDLAQVNRRNPKMILLNFSAFPQTVSTAMEVLMKSDLNLNPHLDGTTVHIPIPKVTREHREKLAKSTNAIFVKCRAAVKEVEIKFSKKLDVRAASENISVEQMRLVREQLTLLANMYINTLEKLKNDKVKELLKDE